MKLFDVLSRQRRLIYLVVAVLSAAGVWAALRLPSAIYPELEFSRITVVAQGSTLGARQVVFSITRPLEEAVSIVPGVTRVRSHSIRGAVEMQITFAPRTDATIFGVARNPDSGLATTMSSRSPLIDEGGTSDSRPDAFFPVAIYPPFGSLVFM